MTFQEIFNKQGYYSAPQFRDLYCYEIDFNGLLWQVYYEDCDLSNTNLETCLIYSKRRPIINSKVVEYNFEEITSIPKGFFKYKSPISPIKE